MSRHFHGICKTVGSIALICLLWMPVKVSAQPPAPGKTLILPFEIHSADDLSFLRNGILDMLSTRLNIPGKSEPIPRATVAEAIASMPHPISENAAVLLGASLGADYVVQGSLTMIGGSISTDARFIDVAENSPKVVFNQTGQNPGEVISHVNTFAGQVSSQVFGISPPHATSPSTASTAFGATLGAAASDVSSHRAHPEKIYNEAMRAGGTSEEAMSDPYGQGRGFRGLPIWRSQHFKSHIRGLAVGDVDGDTRNETVFIDERNIFIYRASSAGFEKVAELPGAITDELISVDVADINANGIAEIFVSGISTLSWTAKSTVREWNGKGFNTITEAQPWFYRVVPFEARGPVLFGQRQGSEKVFSGPPEELGWNGIGYEPIGSASRLPAGIDLYGFAPVRLGENPEEMLLFFDRDDTVRLVTWNGSEQWRSEDSMGGHYVYLEPVQWRKNSRTAKMTGDAEAILNRYYLHQRIWFVDVDGDNRREVLMVNNIDRTGRLLERLRVFRSGHVKCLAWETVGLYEKWRTRSVSGYISDLAVVDFDNDGKLELVTPVVSRTGNFVTDTKSFIMAQELP